MLHCENNRIDIPVSNIVLVSYVNLDQNIIIGIIISLKFEVLIFFI